jgi:hypothetical protein
MRFKKQDLKKHNDIQVKSLIWFKLKPKWNYFNNKREIPRKFKYKEKFEISEV